MEFTPHQKLLYVEQSLKGSGCSSPKVPSSSWYTYKAAYWARSVATLAGQLIITVLLRTSLSQALAAAFLDILCEWSLTSLTKYSTAYLHFIVHTGWSLFTQAAWIKLWMTLFKKKQEQRETDEGLQLENVAIKYSKGVQGKGGWQGMKV